MEEDEKVEDPLVYFQLISKHKNHLREVPKNKIEEETLQKPLI